MKNIAMAFCMAVMSCAQAQKISADKVPSTIIGNFNQQFPHAEKSKWEMEEKNYEVAFHLNQVEYAAIYSPTGEWLETEQEIKSSELPDAVKKAIEKEFGKSEIEEAEKVSLPNNVLVYEVEIEQNKKQTFEVQFSSEGTLLKKEEKHKKENKD